jgi:AcrR family transcriptional regulator
LRTRCYQEICRRAQRFGINTQGLIKGVGLAKISSKDPIKPRERLLDAAYDLFAANGIGQVGIDTILAKSGCAKASLYSNFESKVDLAIAFLERREAVWTRGWLEAEVKRRKSNPDERLLAIFDVFDGWFHKKTFEGCSFINVLLESKVDSPVHRAAAIHLSKIRAIVRSLARDANLRESEKFAQAWHMLMKGSIVSACEGNRNAARDAKRAARMILSGWHEGANRTVPMVSRVLNLVGE